MSTNGDGRGAVGCLRDPQAPADRRDLIDWGFVSELVADCGAGLLADLRDALIEQAASAMPAISQASAVGDAVAVAQTLHSLRGAALTLGMRAFADDALALERAALAGRVPAPSDQERIAQLFSVSLAAVDGAPDAGLASTGMAGGRE